MKRTIRLPKIDYHKTGRKSDYAVIDIELKRKEDKSREYVNLKLIHSYHVFSVNGSIYINNRHDMSGQVIDEISRMYPHNKKVQDIKRIWKEYHLNDLQAGTKKQKNALKQWQCIQQNRTYEKDVAYLKKRHLYKDRGYAYGTAWLVRIIPYSVKCEIRKIIEKD